MEVGRGLPAYLDLQNTSNIQALLMGTLICCLDTLKSPRSSERYYWQNVGPWIETCSSSLGFRDMKQGLHSLYPQKDTQHVHSPIVKRNLIYTHQKQNTYPASNYVGGPLLLTRARTDVTN